MISKIGKQIKGIYNGAKKVISVYKGDGMLYPSISSFCRKWGIPFANALSAYTEWGTSIYSMDENSELRTTLKVPNNSSAGYINGFTLPYYWNQIGKVEMAVQDLDNTSNWMWFAVWTGSGVTGTWLGHNNQSGFSVSSRTSMSNRTVMTDVTVVFTCSNGSQKAHLFSWNEGGWSRNMNVQYVRVYGTDKTTLMMYLIPFERDGVLGMLDLVNMAFLTNTGKGTFTYELKPKP